MRRWTILPLYVERAGVLAGEVGDDGRLRPPDVGGDLVGGRGRPALVLPRESLQPKLVGREGIWVERGKERKEKAMKIKESEFNEKLTGRTTATGRQASLSRPPDCALELSERPQK